MQRWMQIKEEEETEGETVKSLFLDIFVFSSFLGTRCSNGVKHALTILISRVLFVKSEINTVRCKLNREVTEYGVS